MQENRTVGDLLKACRLRANKSQQEMGKFLGYDRSMISRFENNEIEASYSLVRQWCAYTQGLDLMNLDITGGVEAWKKLVKMEDMLRRLKLDLETVSNMRKNTEGQAKKDAGRTGWARLGSLRGRIRS